MHACGVIFTFIRRTSRVSLLWKTGDSPLSFDPKIHYFNATNLFFI